MSEFATLADLAAGADIDEVAEAAANDNAVTGELLRKLIDGGALSSVDTATRNLVTAARDRVQTKLNDADDIINGYLRHRYSTVPEAARETLKPYAVDIALWRLFKGQVQGDEKSPVYTNYQAAIAYLEDVAQGKINLAPASGDGAGTGARANIPQPLFTRQQLAGYG